MIKNVITVSIVIQFYRQVWQFMSCKLKARNQSKNKRTNKILGPVRHDSCS